MSNAKTFSDKQRWIKNSRGQTINLHGEEGSPSVHADSPKTITDAITTVAISSGRRSIEIENRGGKDCFYGGSAVTSANGRTLYSNGESKTWINVKENWTVYFICAAGESTTLRIVEY